MARIKRQVADELVRAIDAAVEKAAEDWRRPHLGGSLIGHRCDRYLWLNFRWAGNPGHDGKKLRLFGRGHREEDNLVALLRQAGLQVQDRDPWTGEQFLVTWGHYGGHADGKVRCFLEERGLPVGEGLLEMKTHNAKSFGYLVEKGIKSAKPEHFAQMQFYMHGLKLEWALYIAVCKDNDDLHAEIVVYDEEHASELMARAKSITEMALPPDRKPDKEQPPCVYVSKDGTRWPCDFYELCWGKQVTERNCRTCIHSTPKAGGRWDCEHPTDGGGSIDVSMQKIGCGLQQSIPQIMVNADVADVTETGVHYTFPDGATYHEKHEEFPQ